MGLDKTTVDVAIQGVGNLPFKDFVRQKEKETAAEATRKETNIRNKEVIRANLQHRHLLTVGLWISLKF